MSNYCFAVVRMFFFKQKTAYGMRIGDWSSDVCSSDLDAAAALFDATQAMTRAAGLPRYEVSNHARPGEESRHNLTYWRYGDYAGIGPGAHGRRLCQATERHRKPENFLSAIARSGHGLKVEEIGRAHV